MSSITRHPPNNRCLSEDVIGSVLTRAKRASHVFGSQHFAADGIKQSEHQAVTPIPALTSELPENTRLFKQTSIPSSRSGVGRPRLSNSQRKQTSAISAEQQLTLYRERRRIIQQQYRLRQRERDVAIEEDVLRLQEEVRRLKQHQEQMCAQVSTKMTPWNVVAEYFRLFHYNLEPSTQFLRATMASDVIVQTGSGVDALLRLWRSISFHHKDLDVRLVRLEHGDAESLIATIKCHFIITRSMLRPEFPHLFSEDGKPSPLAAKLLRQQIVLPSAVRFEWDDSMTFIVQVTGRQVKNEMLSPFLKLLGNLEDVAFVLGGGATSSGSGQ